MRTKAKAELPAAGAMVLSPSLLSAVLALLLRTPCLHPVGDSVFAPLDDAVYAALGDNVFAPSAMPCLHPDGDSVYAPLNDAVSALLS